MERPDHRDEDDGGGPYEEVRRGADAEEVGEAVAAGPEDHHVRLVADGRGEGVGGGQGDAHDERPLVDAREPGRLEAGLLIGDSRHAAPSTTTRPARFHQPPDRSPATGRAGPGPWTDRARVEAASDHGYKGRMRSYGFIRP